MLPTTIRSPPSVQDYTPLEEYQSQTPESFVDGKPILHCHITGAKASILQSQCGNLAIFPSDAAPVETGEANGQGDSEAVVEQKVDVFVSSENLTVFSQEVEAGVSIPYPSISIHAVKQAGSEPEGYSSQVIWMQLEFSDGGISDDEFNTVELTIIPPTSSDASTSLASQLYEAIANCSNLNPDPNDGEDDEEEEFDRIVFEGSAEHQAIEGFSGVLHGSTDGGLPPPLPGSGGWITAENVHEYFDEEGNWIGNDDQGEEELGEGAGRTRNRDELDGTDGVNGDGSHEDAENKRPRVE